MRFDLMEEKLQHILEDKAQETQNKKVYELIKVIETKQLKFKDEID